MREERNHEMVQFTKSSKARTSFLSTSLTWLVFIFCTIINQTAAMPCKCERHKYNLYLMVSLINRLWVKGWRKRKWVKQKRKGKESSKAEILVSEVPASVCPQRWGSEVVTSQTSDLEFPPSALPSGHCALAWLHQQKGNSQALLLSEWTWQLQAPRPPAEGHSNRHRPVRWLREGPRVPLAATPCQLYYSEKK